MDVGAVFIVLFILFLTAAVFFLFGVTLFDAATYLKTGAWTPHDMHWVSAFFGCGDMSWAGADACRTDFTFASEMIGLNHIINSMLSGSTLAWGTGMFVILAAMSASLDM